MALQDSENRRWKVTFAVVDPHFRNAILFMVLPDMVIHYWRIIRQRFIIRLLNGEQAVWNGFDINVGIKIPLAVLNRSVSKFSQMVEYEIIWLRVFVAVL